jgi:hypothetical protein
MRPTYEVYRRQWLLHPDQFVKDDPMDPKSIFASKTFWFNVVSLGATFTGYLPPKYAVVVVPVINVLLRMLTEQPVKVF